jgi:hypothetical protein
MVIFAIDDAAANDVMVFRMVRRSGLLYRIVSSLAAVRFAWLLEVVWLATNTVRLEFGTTARNYDSLTTGDANKPPGAAAPREWASSHFDYSQQWDGVAARVAGQKERRNVSCFALSITAHAG